MGFPGLMAWPHNKMVYSCAALRKVHDSDGSEQRSAQCYSIIPQTSGDMQIRRAPSPLTQRLPLSKMHPVCAESSRKCIQHVKQATVLRVQYDLKLFGAAVSGHVGVKSSSRPSPFVHDFCRIKSAPAIMKLQDTALGQLDTSYDSHILC